MRRVVGAAATKILVRGVALSLVIAVVCSSAGAHPVGVAPAASAHESADGPYDALRVVQRALSHHLGVRLAQLQYEAAQARSVESRAVLRPTLTVDVKPYWLETWVPDTTRLPDFNPPGGANSTDLLGELLDLLIGGLPERLEHGHGYTATLSGRVSLWKSPLQRALETIAVLDSVQAEADLEAAVGGAIIQSLEAYYGVLRAEAAVHLAELNLEEVRLRAEEIASKKVSGTATRVDELRIEAELYQAEARVIQARGEATVAHMGLNQTLGFPPDTRLAVVEMDIPAAWPELDEAMQLSTRRGDVQQAQNNLEKARAAAVIAREQAGIGIQLFGQYRWPDVELSVGVDRQGYLGGTVSHNRLYLGGEQSSGEPETWTAGIELSWPILDGHERRAKVVQAELQAEEAALAAQQVYESVAAEVTAAYARLQAAEQALNGARRGVSAATEAVAVAQELAAAGAATERDVVLARLALAQAEQGRVEATYAFALAQAAYLQSAGVLLPHWLELVGLEHVPWALP